MGKPSRKKKKTAGGKSRDPSSKKNKHVEIKSKAFDEDTTVFTNMAQELKEEGNKLFQRRDHEGAMLKYVKALNLLPSNHIDVAHLRCSMAACFMQMGHSEYHKAIDECNLALEAFPKYSKALLKRARCYEALNRLQLALRDANIVLSCEPNNLMALEISDRVSKELEKKGIQLDEKEALLTPEYVDPVSLSHQIKSSKQRTKKKKSYDFKSNNTEDKEVVQEKPTLEKEPPKTMKLVYGEDIRCVQVPANSTIMQVREIIKTQFPALEAFHIKYKDEEGDLVTIISPEELRRAEAAGSHSDSVKLFVVEVSPCQDPLFEEARKLQMESGTPSGDEYIKPISEKVPCREDWVVHFAHLFKSHVGFTSDEYLDLHEMGAKLYLEAMEEVVTSEEAQAFLDMASERFQEMAALALFNWGNVHMSRARKRVMLSDDASNVSILAWAKDAYEWARKEYEKAGDKYKEALKIKPNFYEGFLALAQQQFEQAKLSWYYAVGTNVDLKTWPSVEVIDLFNNAEMNMTSGSVVWEQIEAQCLMDQLKPFKEKNKSFLQEMGFEEFSKDVAADKGDEREAKFKYQIYLLWGNILYERSVIEYKLGVEYWEDCLEAAIEKFEDAGASRIDIAVMRKNHCSNSTAQGGLVFKIDEIIQAWNEMDIARRWLGGVSFSRLEPLIRRRSPKLHNLLESVHASF